MKTKQTNKEQKKWDEMSTKIKERTNKQKMEGRKERGEGGWEGGWEERKEGGGKKGREGGRDDFSCSIALFPLLLLRFAFFYSHQFSRGSRSLIRSPVGMCPCSCSRI